MRKQRKKPSAGKKAARWLVMLTAAGVLAVFAVSGAVRLCARPLIADKADAAGFSADCVLVLGCGVWGDEPSPMLADRLSVGIELYGMGAAPKLLMSGDHGQEDYDEVNVMKRVALGGGVPAADIFTDHAGFSTYESLYRARDVFGVRRVVVVTQAFHLPRALYIARRLGLEAVGVASDLRPYGSIAYSELREIPARCKDFAWCLFGVKPTYLGDAIPISGDGSASEG